MASQATNLQANAPDVQVLDLEADSPHSQEQKESIKIRSSKYLQAVPNLSDIYRLVMKRVAWKWEKLATMLELDNNGRKIDAIRRDFWGVGVEICCMQAIHHWVRGEGKTPVSWRTLLKCLEDIECGQIAEEIAKKLEGELYVSLLNLCLWSEVGQDENWMFLIGREGGREEERERERERGREGGRERERNRI